MVAYVARWWALLVVGLLVVVSCGHGSVNSDSSSSSVVAKQVHLDVSSFDHCRFGPSDFTAVGLPAMQLRDKPQREVFYSKMHNKDITIDNCYYIDPTTQKDDDSSTLRFIISKYLLDGKPMPVSQIVDFYTFFGKILRNDRYKGFRVHPRTIKDYPVFELDVVFLFGLSKARQKEYFDQCGIYVAGLYFYYEVDGFEERTTRICQKVPDFVAHVLL